ncbi:MAG TPA: hypothetical protein VGG39_28560 [Polyangiaceae bacterium]|jgi:hypothetical protein
MSQSIVAVTPSDTLQLGFAANALWVGVTGDIVVVGRDPADAAATLKAVPQGLLLLPQPILQVKATGTTATNLVAFVGGTGR